jgi:hypothetical protein
MADDDRPTPLRDDRPPLPDVSGTDCPACGQRTLTVAWELVAKDVGTFSLAGATMKFSAYQAPVLRCTNCGVSSVGRFEGGQG